MGTNDDIDVHLALGTLRMCTSADCYAVTCTNTASHPPDWAMNGASRAQGAPMLDVDAINGPGPETVTVVDPPDGVYLAGAYAATVASALFPSDVTVTISIDDGALLTSETRQLFQGDLWAPFSITVPPVDFTVTRYNGCAHTLDSCIAVAAAGPQLFQCPP